jgi:large subunit ribosomal protein L29
MKIKELRDKDTPALVHELKDKQKHLFTLRSQAVTEKLEDPTQLKKTRRDIAQIRTILRQREMETAASAAKTAAAK